VAATIVFWAASALTWGLLLLRIDRTDSELGWDLVTVWRAEGVFAHGGQPYNRAATAGRLYLYPPSSLLVLRPLAVLSLHEVAVLGLISTAALAWGTVVVTSAALGRRWWGLTSAVVVFALRWAQPMVAELKLDNVTVICTLALAVFFLLMVRGHSAAAAAVIGLSLAVKPLLLPVVVVFLLARKWRDFGIAVAIPAVLNAIAFAVVADPNQVWQKLPSLLDRSGAGTVLNSAWVGVAQILGLPGFAATLIRIATVAIVVATAWWAWNELSDSATRLITTASVLLIGAYLAGTLSENHFMMTLVPLAMTAVVAGAPMRWFTGWIGILWLMGLTPPASMLGLDTYSNLSAFQAFGMALVLVTIAVVLWHRRYGTGRPASSVPADHLEAEGASAGHAQAGHGQAGDVPATPRRDGAIQPGVLDGTLAR
jgi:arabinofuranan 3-O-arabinosyltransferase